MAIQQIYERMEMQQNIQMRSNSTSFTSVGTKYLLNLTAHICLY